ncbi:MAG: hypothetical protein LC768_08305 [Acidobacteria bacterium]|nr:hypothetical protein [Acidobacteriota bacterium]
MFPIPEQNEVLLDFTNRLERLGIAYMLTGSMAMAHYAQPRMTADLDVVIELNLSETDEIIKNFEPEYYIPHGSMRLAVAKKKMFNMLHEKTLVKVDCILRKQDEYQINAFNRRRRVNFADFDLWIISHEDLILSKLSWAKKTDSEMQLRDATNLLRGKIDLEYIKFWSNKLKVDKTLTEILERLNDE